MFSLILNGIFVLTMFKKPYFLIGQSSTNGAYGHCVDFATPLDEAQVVAPSSPPFANNIQEQFLELFLDIFFSVPGTMLVNHLSTLTFVICRLLVT